MSSPWTETVAPQPWWQFFPPTSRGKPCFTLPREFACLLHSRGAYVSFHVWPISLRYCFHSPSMLWCVPELHSLLWPTNSPCVDITHLVVQHSAFWETANLSSQVAAPLYRLFHWKALPKTAVGLSEVGLFLSSHRQDKAPTQVDGKTALLLHNLSLCLFSKCFKHLGYNTVGEAKDLGGRQLSSAKCAANNVIQLIESKCNETRPRYI